MTANSSSSDDSHAKAIRERLRAFVDRAGQAGLSGEGAEALFGIDASAFVWRRRMLKSELVRSILAALAVDIEQTEFETLTALSRLQGGFLGEARPEVTVGDIAEEMAIDPSRASRLVASLVAKGFIRRDVAQNDARKTILRSTPASRALFDAFMTLKWKQLFGAFRAWNDSDLAAFERLLARYLETMHEVVDGAGSDKDEAARLAKTVRDAAGAELASR